MRSLFWVVILSYASSMSEAVPGCTADALSLLVPQSLTDDSYIRTSTFQTAVALIMDVSNDGITLLKSIRLLISSSAPRNLARNENEENNS